MIITGLLTGAALGFILQRGRFCITSAFRDLWVSRSSFWLTAFLVAIAIQAAGVALLARRQLRLTAARGPQFALPARRTGVAHLLLEKRWNPLATGAVVGIVAAAAWPLSWATGREDGLGITTPSANLIGVIVTGDTSRFDWGVLLVLGILLGSYIAAKASGEFRVRVPDATIIIRSILGGLLMGVGAAWAGGCSIGNALVQTSLLSWQGWIALVFQILGVGAAAWVLLIRPRQKRRAARAARASAAADAEPTPAREAAPAPVPA